MNHTGQMDMSITVMWGRGKIYICIDMGDTLARGVAGVMEGQYAYSRYNVYYCNI